MLLTLYDEMLTVVVPDWRAGVADVAAEEAEERVRLDETGQDIADRYAS